jgi:hypothetical protein
MLPFFTPEDLEKGEHETSLPGMSIKSFDMFGVTLAS